MDMSEIKIPIENTMYYSFDKVSCFEQPIGNLLNYKNGYYGHAFIMLSKIFQFYFLKPNHNFKVKLINLVTEILNVDIVEITSLFQHFNKLKFELKKQNPLIVGINCRKLFYSDHYKIEDWPHWMLISGYNPMTDTIQIIDDLHLLYCNRENEYGHFYLTNNILKSIYKSYIGKYGREWSCFTFCINDEKPLMKLIISIIDYYLQFDFKSCSFTQIRLLKEYFCCDNGEIKKELSKKIINTNKYRSVFIDLIKKYMNELRYSKKNILWFDSVNKRLEKFWANYVLINLSNIENHRCDNLELPYNIIESEIEISRIINDFKKYLEELVINEENTQYKELETNLIIENDPDKIININNNSISFKFRRNKTYNWWYDDEAPKVILISNINSNENLRACTKIEIHSNYLESNFQAGIFLRTKTETLFASIDLNDLFVLDKIGFINNSCKFKFSTKIEIMLSIKHKRIAAKITNGRYESKMEWSLNSNSNFDIGLSCKTWGNGEKLEVDFLKYYIEAEEKHDEQ